MSYLSHSDTICSACLHFCWTFEELIAFELEMNLIGIFGIPYEFMRSYIKVQITSKPKHLCIYKMWKELVASGWICYYIRNITKKQSKTTKKKKSQSALV